MLTNAPPNENQDISKDSNAGASGSRGKDKEDNSFEYKEEDDTGFHLNGEATKNKVLQDIQTKLVALTHRLFAKGGDYAHIHRKGIWSPSR